MNLIERYLHAVEFWLPRRQRADILAELREDLQSQLDDREAVLGRPLTDDEVSSLLKQRGRPMLVAQRFQPQRSLIGPNLFPIYLAIVKIVGFFYFVPGFLAAVLTARGQHPGDHWAQTLSLAWNHIALTALTALGVITAIFAALEYTGAADRALSQWEPAKLPAPKDRNRIPRGTSAADLIANLIFLPWWMADFSSPHVLNGPRLQITLFAGWRYFFWGFAAIAIWHILLAAANLLHPVWSRLRATLYLLVHLAAGVLFCLEMRAPLITSLQAAGLGPAKSALLMQWFNLIWSQCLPVAAVITAVIFAVDLWRLIRLARNPPPHTQSPALSGVPL